MRVILQVLIIALAFPLAANAQQSMRAKVHPESTIQIHGTSTVNSFVCQTGAIEGWAEMQRQGRAVDPSVSVVVPIRSFNCGNRRMNSDMQAAMKASTHPAIQFELTEARLVDGPASGNGEHRLLVDGKLKLAGTERAISFFVSGREESDGRMYVTGHAPLLMSDFGIVPPTALLGLVQAHDRIEVRFDLVATLDRPATARR